RFLAQIDQRGGVDVDVVEAGVDGLAHQVAHGGDFLLGVSGKALGRDLEVVALDEERALKAFSDGGGEHAGDVFGGPLVGVANLGAGDFEDESADVELVGRPEDSARHLEVHGAHVNRRDGEGRRDFAPADSHV